MTKDINHVDCFAGPGGICTGFKAAGIKTLVAIEKIESCVDTYKANHSDVQVIHKDIREITAEQIKKSVGNKKIHILSSGMPCETFSTAGSSSRSFYDFRQQLYSEAIRIAKAVNAKIILFENVPAIETKKVDKNGERLIVDDIIEELAVNGYNDFVKTILNANDFGVPQNRNRFFLIATNDKKLKLKVPVSHHNTALTVADAFVGLPLLKANETKDHSKFTNEKNDYSELLQNREFWKIKNNIGGNLTYHISPKHRKGTIERFSLLKQGESLIDLFKKFDDKKIKELQEQRVLPKKWYIQRNKRLKINEPSKTVTSHCLDELVHPTLNRALTVREVARLQGFPDYYDFKGGPLICPHIYETQDKYEQIGDAVPPLLAYSWGLTIIDILNEAKG